LGIYNGDLIVGGNFQSAGGVPGTYCIAKWHGGAWSTVGPPNSFTGSVYALTVHNSDLIAAGNFNNPGGSIKLAKWNGSAWSSLGNGITDGSINTVYSTGGVLYAGGYFTQIAGVPANKIAQWNGSSWSPLGTGITDVNGGVATITDRFWGLTGGIVVGDSFYSAGGINVNHVAYYNNGYWYSMGNGLDNPVHSLFTPIGSGNVIAGGGFSSHIRRWESFSWEPLGGGIDTGAVYAISALSVGNVFAGGSFNLPGVIPANIAYYNGGWISLGSMNDDVNEIYETIIPYTIYAAGRFTMANGVPANRIARLSAFYPVYHRIMLNKSITDNNSVYDTMAFPHDNILMSFKITDVNLIIDTVLHTNDDDLEFTLIHNNIRDTAIYRVGSSGDNLIGTVLNDSAANSIENGSPPFTGAFRPSKPLSKFNGASVDGDWILQIYDRATGNTGIFEAWSLSFRLEEVIGIQPVSSEIPTQFTLSQNYPNPFNPSTKIRFTIPKAGAQNNMPVQLKVYDILGRELETLVNESLKPGTYEADFDGSKYSSGVYYCRLIIGDLSETRKMILNK